MVMMRSLRDGEKVRVGQAILEDRGVHLPRQSFFGGSGAVYCAWHETHVWSANGSFFIGSRTDKKVYAQMEYLTTDNATLLEMTIRTFFKSDKGRLSETYDD